MASRVATWILVLSLWAAACFAQQHALRLFESGSLDDILAQRAGRAFMLVIWSLDCPSCIRDLDILAEMRQQYPQLDMVMIVTDDRQYQQQVRDLLARHNLQDVEAWIFANTPARRLRYEIDSHWYGEVPRTYFYNANHDRIPYSGALEKRHIENWLAATR